MILLRKILNNKFERTKILYLKFIYIIIVIVTKK